MDGMHPRLKNESQTIKYVPSCLDFSFVSCSVIMDVY